MGSLYITATPIGNLGDMTFRAVEVLKQVSHIACEDTRHSAKLLTHYGISAKLISCRAQNEEKAAALVLEYLKTGDVAYMSDAGTPGISDPGQKLVSIVRKNGFPVIPLPGVSALTTLASVSGLGGKTLTFEGFLSIKQGKRKKRLQQLLEREETFIFYESPHRILKVIQDLTDLNPDCTLLIGREMTKMYEEFISGTAENVLHMLEKHATLKGEFAVIVSARPK
ncbi:MAG: 16S rRNA (cytidine(1402)-2'-O)-methyltransferase [Spirochaetales bacterium]|nr:16S rRNA (cytidine(1402)-2'-O)-methyltransferase [Spirochaetales bacterium]